VTEPIRFHLDENVDPVIAVALRQYGIDVTTTVDADLRSTDDYSQLAFAISEGRVIVSHDSDFLRIAATILNIQESPIVTWKHGR
jgi:predicted nuclease of predicted toxin-antitoxin system